MEAIVLYDVSKIHPTPWNPNTWKTRFALNMKRLKFTTEWVEYPDIESTLKKLGAPPTGKTSDGRDYYTLPTIFDPNTKKVVTDSVVIAKYLDETYPDDVKLIPAGTDAFQEMFHEFIWMNVGIPLMASGFVDALGVMDARSGEYFRVTRERMFGKKFEEFGEAEWQKVEAGLGALKRYLEANGKGDDLLLMGPQVGITHSDLQFAGMLACGKDVWGENSEQWKRLMGFHGGKWSRYYAQFIKFEK
ncbi:uncharacterized protein PHACADRAFT_261958 [Phanerochaete carnosa HHB-10118-sp]|uniref:GST N-terminal domain-containing protein n=1 Tax=Phanerochaete carnosa (strain HHB-10118-sp) TaxID=650164 RepID=K5VXX5_PHACS|nr:uncharacterized protein PHACADRAFT_261958 [Phanerochaete carnosa HHB-10118-sp]EKM51675.1 hypothetical protein PHACADRAFT_261958 [Phanerochaete carnosa HHB-10118-sp]